MWALDKKKPFSFLLARWRGLVQACAALLTNLHLPNFFKGELYRGAGKTVRVPGLNCYSCPGAAGACPKIPTKKLSTKRLKPLTYLKYVILVVMVFLLPVLVVNEAGMGDPFFCNYLCPQGVLEGAIPLSLVNSSIRAALGKLFSWKLCVLITVVVLSVIFYRPFCKWLCPLGAFYALFNRVSLLSMHVDESKCVSCGKCARTCPMDVDVTKTPNHSECIRCGKCVTACPTEAVRFRYAFGSGGACSKLSQKPIIEENKGE